MDSCSFCGKARREVRKLIAGPEVWICNECIDLCNDVILGEEEVWKQATLDDGRGLDEGGTRMAGWDYQEIAAPLAARLRTAAARQRDAAAEVEQLADAIVAGNRAEIERCLARFGGKLERIGLPHDVGQTLDMIRFLWSVP